MGTGLPAVRLWDQIVERTSGLAVAGASDPAWRQETPSPGGSETSLKAAFTLIELLVVLAVLAILAGLLLPALSRANARVRGAVCLNHLKQWGLATHLYAIDNDDYLPPEGSPNGLSTSAGWYINLPATLGMKPYCQMPWRTNAAAPLGSSIWICPASTNRSNGLNLFHYCLNEHVDETGAEDRGIRISSVDQPGQVVWLFDNGKRAAVAQQNNVHTNLHQRGAQFLFLDGHSARYPNRAYWDFISNKGRTNNPDLIWIPGRAGSSH